MIQDHIKLRWLQGLLEDINWMQHYNWTLIADNDESNSCIDPSNQLHYELDLEYEIQLYIREYTRPITEMRRILNEWLSRANPKPHQVIRTDYELIDNEKMDVVFHFRVTEIQRDIECDEQDHEYTTVRDGQLVYLKLDRAEPDELTELKAVYCGDRPCCQH